MSMMLYNTYMVKKTQYSLNYPHVNVVHVNLTMAFMSRNTPSPRFSIVYWDH